MAHRADRSDIINQPDASTRSFEPLSPQDASFLAFEHDRCYMHVGVVGIFEGTSFRVGDGALDFEKLERYMLARLTGCAAFVYMSDPKLGRQMLADLKGVEGV